MASVSEKLTVEKVAEIAERLGFKAIVDPNRPPFRIFGWFPGRKFRPDILVKGDHRAAIVIVSLRPTMMYDVFLTHQARGKEDTGALICVSDADFPRIRGSSREYASDLNVRLCPLSEVGDALKELLD